MELSVEPSSKSLPSKVDLSLLSSGEGSEKEKEKDNERGAAAFLNHVWAVCTLFGFRVRVRRT